MPIELANTARQAAAAGAAVLRELLNQERQVAQKGRFDFVTEADRRSENAVLEVIRRAHPDHGILAEESDDGSGWRDAQKGLVWVVDPLDGTTNYIHRFPVFAVSVAVIEDGHPLAGAVVDVARDEEFWGHRGGGAHSGEQRLKVSPTTDPGSALFLTGFPFRQKRRLGQYLEVFKELFEQVSGIRRAGAAALDLAWIAAGRAEGFWEIGLSPWDVAAGRLLIEEAGGRVSDFGGGEDGFLWSGSHIASNGHLHELILASCRRHLPA